MTIASADAKTALTSQLYDLEYMLQYGKNREGTGAIGADAGYAQAAVALRDLALYDDFASSWFGPALGGFESKQELVRRFTAVRDGYKAKMQTPKQVVAVQRIADKVPIHAIEAKSCEEDPQQAAIDTYGPFVGRLPGAQILTCHRKKTIAIGSVLVVLVVLGVLAPYANLLSKVVGRKKRKNRRK